MMINRRDQEEFLLHNYLTPVYENDLRLKHMVMLKKKLYCDNEK